MASAFHDGWSEDVFAYNDYGVNPMNGNATLQPPFAGVPYLITESVGVEEARPAALRLDRPAGTARQAGRPCTPRRRAWPGRTPAIPGCWPGPGSTTPRCTARIPTTIKWAGVADGFRVPKPGAAIYQSQVDPSVRPVILPVFFWELGGAAARRPADAMIASNCEQLEIFIGGTHVTTALPASDSPLYSDLRPTRRSWSRLPPSRRTPCPSCSSWASSAASR